MGIVVVRILIKNSNALFKFNGTAFFINDNTLVTAKHVVENAMKKDYEIYISEIPNGGKLLIPLDAIQLCERDIAVFRIKKKFDIEKVDFIDTLKVKSNVLIEGYHNENGSKSSYEHHVSAYVNSEHTYVLQSHITNGLSGSPVLLDGKVCGIAQAIHRNDNLTFVIPISEVCIEDDKYVLIYKILEERKEEIEQYLKNNNLDMATKRTMDMVNDFTINSTKRQEIVKIKGQFKVLGSSLNSSILLKNKLLEMTSSIEKEFPKVIKEENYFNERNSLLGNEENKAFVAENISMAYKKNSFSLKPISLELKYGEITVLVGENGNGKTTLLNIIAGQIAHNEGSLYYPTLDKENKKDWYDIKTQISYIEQYTLERKGIATDSLHFILGINGVKGQENIDEVNFIMHRLGLEKYENFKWAELSGGFKMRFSLAQALLRKPKLLILDEPLANLDINTQQLFLNDLRDITSSLSYDMAVVISSQNLYEMEMVADNIIFLSEGEAIYNGSMKTFGEKRDDNSYEFSINVSEEYLLEVLKTIDYLKLKQEGDNYILTTKKSVSYASLLKLFLDNKIEIKYFRDISKSTRKLFGEIG